MEPQSKEDIQRRILYQMREMSMTEVPGGYIVAIEGEEQRQRFFTSELGAWTYFIDTLDARVRRRIKKYLERKEKEKNEIHR